MRGLFLLLFLTNLVFLVWQYSTRHEGQVVVHHASVAVDDNRGLILLSELEPGQRPTLRDGTDEEAVPVNQSNRDIQQESINQNDPEAQDDSHEDISRQTEVGGDVCLAMNDIDSEARLQQLLDLLKTSRASEIEQGEKQGTKKNYWVMLAPYPNRAKADEAASILASSRIKDFFIVRSGEYENAISLGVFSELERAKRRYEQIRAKKVRLRSPRIETVEAPAKRYYVNFRLDGDEYTSLLDTLQARDYPSLTKIKCR